MKKGKITRKNLNLPACGIGEKMACYILITCADPTADGQMSVEMSYEGDVNLAALMIDHAHGYIHEALEDAESAL